MNLEAAFRELRDEWFKAQLRPQSHERDWEIEEERVVINQQRRELFDKQTEEIISGEDKPIAPTCEADMWTQYKIDEAE